MVLALVLRAEAAVLALVQALELGLGEQAQAWESEALGQAVRLAEVREE